MPWVLFGFLGFILVRPGGRWVHSGSLESFGCAVGVVGFILGRWVHSGATWALFASFGCNLGVSGFIRFRWVHSSSPLGSVASFGFAGFIRVRLGCHFCSLVSFGYALVVALGVFQGPIGSFVYTRRVVVFVGGRWVQPGGRLANTGSLDSFGCVWGLLG